MINQPKQQLPADLLLHHQDEDPLGGGVVQAWATGYNAGLCLKLVNPSHLHNNSSFTADNVTVGIVAGTGSKVFSCST